MTQELEVTSIDTQFSTSREEKLQTQTTIYCC